MPTAIAVIPARYAAQRFPGKPLADQTGKPLIQHVVEQVRRTRNVVRIIVATDDARIADAVASFGGEAMMTRADHPNGTARIAEVVAELERQQAQTKVGEPAADLPDIIVNVQGDEPEIEPGVIDQLVEGLAHDRDAPMATLASPFAPGEDPADPNIVKLVVDQHGRAMYFSRSVIPLDRDRAGARLLKHPGLYAYRRRFLPTYLALPATPLEQAEKLEQLRALEHGHRIAVIRVRTAHHGIDTPEQYAAFVERYRAASADAPGTGSA
jgi:3-deoxy-manno-octulosonate cytidylyltransferase (CMP-KDO synthetase)